MMHPDRVARLKAEEKQRFETTELMAVRVRRAPWSELPRRYGTVATAAIRRGQPLVVLDCGLPERFDSLDAMLEHWIGD